MQLWMSGDSENILLPEFAIRISDSRIARFSRTPHNEFAARLGPSEIAGFRQLVLALLTKLARRYVIHFKR